MEYYGSVRYHGPILALKFQKSICYYLKSIGSQNVCYETCVTFYNREDESVTFWSHTGYIFPPNKHCILIWHNGINCFDWIKDGVPSKYPTKVVDISLTVNYKYLPVNNKIPPLVIDNVTNIETKTDVQILPISWDPADLNTNPPPNINNFKHNKLLSRGRFVKNQEIYPPRFSSKRIARSISKDQFEKFDWL